MRTTGYTESPEQKAASDYFNSLPPEQRAKLAPLLDWYRQAGLAEAQEQIRGVADTIGRRIQGIRGRVTP